MGKNKRDKPLTHEEIWDDSALVQSWDAAVEEYKLYHSIHAKGENVEDVLRQAQEAEAETDGHEISADQVNDEDVDVVMETDVNAGVDPEPKTETATGNTAPESTENVGQGSSVPPSSLPMPEPLLAQVKDENLKRLMMSWYFAGYYTGLYEGQQQASQSKN